MTTQADVPKITYTTMSVGEAENLHRAFDQALREVRADLGREFPLVIGGHEEGSTATAQDLSPNDQRLVLDRFKWQPLTRLMQPSPLRDAPFRRGVSFHIVSASPCFDVRLTTFGASD